MLVSKKLASSANRASANVSPWLNEDRPVAQAISVIFKKSRAVMARRHLALLFD